MKKHIEAVDLQLIHWFQKWYTPLARGSLFVVYFWFGILKVLGLSPATPLAEALTLRTVGADWFDPLYLTLAIIECIIGLLFLFPKLTRLAIAVMVGHMVLVCSPLVLLADMVWMYPFVPSLEGQYIIKNVVLIAVAISIASTVRPLKKVPLKRA
ncbi:MAG: hypothetical protein WAZ21_04930 [Candidatus Saccharimonadales bacterium]